MGTFFIYESNNKFEMYQYGLSGWIDIVKTVNARMRMYFLGVAFLIATILILISFRSFPEWLKGIAFIFEVIVAVSVISRFALSENVLIMNSQLEPDKILASRKSYLLKNCGRLTDGINFFYVFYVQWEDGAGIVINGGGELLREHLPLVPAGASEKDKNSTWAVRKNEIKESLSFDIMDSEKILDIVKDSYIVHRAFATPITKEQIGKEILEKISKGC